MEISRIISCSYFISTHGTKWRYSEYWSPALISGFDVQGQALILCIGRGL